MRTRTSRSTTPSFHTFLKPGALAQLRYSKISAKSRLKSAQSCQHIPLSVIPSSEPLPTMEGLPCFKSSIRIRHPRCIQRKKLSAVAPIFTESNSWSFSWWDASTFEPGSAVDLMVCVILLLVKKNWPLCVMGVSNWLIVVKRYTEKVQLC